MSNVTLIVIPGPGARSVNITNQMTVEQLVVQESLHGRDIIVNGAGVMPQNYSTTILAQGMEIFATGSVKGNVKNGPSTTGRPSGRGRGNNPSRSK